MTASVRNVPFTFRVGEITLGSISRRMLVRIDETFGDDAPRGTRDIERDLVDLPFDVHGVLYRSLRVDNRQTRLSVTSSRIRYVPRQYERYFADLRVPYEEYLKSFSRKSRSSLRRKVRKFEQASDGTIRWRCYRTPAEIEEFYALARSVSVRSYQERLLDAGLPDTDTFREAMIRAASDGNIRAYLIFMDGEAVSYLYCPIRDGVVRYAYLGYLLEYTDLSPGTVLLWLAMEDLFKEGQHRVFDFTEGGDPSKHGQKRLFATGGVQCADIYVLRFSLSNAGIVLAHAGAEWIVEQLGRFLDAVGVKRRARSVARRFLGAGKS